MDLRRKESSDALEHKMARVAYIALLRQKAKCTWLKKGDLNIKIFHRSIKKRHVQNAIFDIHNDVGVWLEQPDMVTHVFLAYYQHMLGSRMSERRAVKRSIVHKGLW